MVRPVEIMGNRQKSLATRLIALVCLGYVFSLTAARAQSDAPDLVIQNDTDLPDTYLGATYNNVFHARGGTPTFHWQLESGALPRGLKLEDGGELHGTVEQGGEFQFTVKVIDGSKPQQALHKVFNLRVRSGLVIAWQDVAKVAGSRIDGSVMARNTTDDDIDLTFIVVALPPNGRAVAIGYQHFVLRRGQWQVLPFGDTLPFGGYTVRVDAIGEVATKKLILREHLDTGQMQVAVGP